MKYMLETYRVSQAFDGISDALTGAADGGSLLVENIVSAQVAQSSSRAFRTHDSACGSADHACNVSLSKCTGCVANGLANAFSSAGNSLADVLGGLSDVLAHTAADLQHR
jgi:hypothetical protein